MISAYLISWDSNLFVLIFNLIYTYVYSQEQLWQGIKNGTLDMIVSDHSPCVSELKTYGNFLTAWGGISSLQFGIYLWEYRAWENIVKEKEIRISSKIQIGLPLIWTAARTRDISFSDVSKLLSSQPARLCGLEDRKGDLSVGMDADFVIWNPEESIKVSSAVRCINFEKYRAFHMVIIRKLFFHRSWQMTFTTKTKWVNTS